MIVVYLIGSMIVFIGLLLYFNSQVQKGKPADGWHGGMVAVLILLTILWPLTLVIQAVRLLTGRGIS